MAITQAPRQPLSLIILLKEFSCIIPEVSCSTPRLSCNMCEDHVSCFSIPDYDKSTTITNNTTLKSHWFKDYVKNKVLYSLY